MSEASLRARGPTPSAQPLRVIRPVLTPGMFAFVMLFVSVLAALPATIGGFLLAELVSPMAAFVIVTTLWVAVVGGYLARMVLGMRASSDLLFADRLVSRYAHPRKVGIHVVEEVLPAAEVCHLERQGRTFYLGYERGEQQKRLDVREAEADEVWSALCGWREAAPGAYSLALDELDVGYPRAGTLEPLLGGGRRPVEVAIEWDGRYRCRIVAGRVTLDVEALRSLRYRLSWNQPGALQVKEVGGLVGRGVVAWNGIRIASWRVRKLGGTDYLFGDRRLERQRRELLEEGRPIGTFETGWGGPQGAQLTAETEISAALIGLLLVLPGLAYDARSRGSSSTLDS